MAASALPHITALTRHFGDLRDGAHGGQADRRDKERLFERAVAMLDPHARRALQEINTELLLGSGAIRLGRDPGEGGSPRGPVARWTLTWPEQSAAGLPPVSLLAHFGPTFHHPHLRGRTVGEWPLNVKTKADGAAQLPVLRAIASAELHNLVFEADYHIIPSVVQRPTAHAHPSGTA